MKNPAADPEFETLAESEGGRRLAERIRTFPTTPGVYVMKDRAGVVVYVGKAQNVRARLRQYFAASSGDTRFFVKLLDQVLGDIEVVTTRTAAEALLVENELIKAHQPRFNVKLKDDKNFLNLRLGPEHAFPRLEVTRIRKKDGARYFGPYASASALRQALRVVNRHFQLRTCRDTEFANRSRPCLEYQIKRCPGPCVLPVPESDYARSVREVSLFLDGRTDELLDELRGNMGAAVEAMDFERAARIRDQVKDVEQSLEKQEVVMQGLDDLDVLGLCREGPFVAVHVQRVRRGRVAGAQPFRLGRNEAPDALVLGEFVSRYYGPAAEIPREILLPLPIDDADLMEAQLTERRGARVELKVPARGERKRLVDMACRNAEGALALDKDKDARARDVLGELQRRLRLTRFPERVECFDISNIQGTDPVASMVVFVGGEPEPSQYRTFHIRCQDTPDDFLMMREALTRRFERSRKGDWVLPDLLVIDGGKGQLGVAFDVLRELEVGVANGPGGNVGIDLCSLAKARVQNDAPDAPVERSFERVFVPGVKDPIVLKQNSAPLYLLTRLRDEAHRFAITFHRKTRGKARVGSALDAIEGVGPARRKALLARFRSLEGVRRADIAAIAETDGVGPTLAQRIVAALARP